MANHTSRVDGTDANVEVFPAIVLAVRGNQSLVRDLRTRKIRIVDTAQLDRVSVPLRSLPQFPVRQETLDQSV